MRRTRDRSPIPLDAVKFLLQEAREPMTAKALADLARSRIMGPKTASQGDIQRVTRHIALLHKDAKVRECGRVHTDDRGGRPAQTWRWVKTEADFEAECLAAELQAGAEVTAEKSDG